MEGFALGEANLEKLKHLGPDNQDLPASPDLDSVANNLSEAKTKEDYHAAILRIYSCLRQLALRTAHVEQVNKVDEHDGASQVPRLPLANQQALDSLARYLIVNGLPIFPAELGTQSAQDTEPDYSRCRSLAEASLASLALISCLRDHPEISDRDLLSIIAYTNASDPWSSDYSAKYADRLLKQHLPDERRFNVIIQTLLQDTLRPLFSRPSARLTASGRPSRYDQPTISPYDRVHRHETPQWKQTGCFNISTFRYAIKSDMGLVAKHWPLFLPVIIALVEDDATAVRIYGLHIMRLFLDACPSDIVRSTGMSSVFRDAVFPTLLFLPSLTPERESIRLLRPAYNVLLKLAHLEPQFPCPQRQKLLDKLIRDGILAGYTHASQHTRIVEVLMEATKAIVDCMGVYAVKHLQNIIQIISPVLTDPFATLYPPTVISAAEALNTILVKCWPRSSEYMEPAINAIARCWLNIEQATVDGGLTSNVASKLSHQDRAELRRHLLKISTTLHSMWKQQGRELPQKLSSIVQQEPQLGQLFGQS